MAVQVNNSFQAFVQNFLGIPVPQQGKQPESGGQPNGSPGNQVPGGPPPGAGVVPVGVIPSPPTLTNFIAQLNQQVTKALTTVVFTTNRIQPSVRNSPTFSPYALTALVPYAQAQLTQLGQTLAAHPPTFDAHGKLTSPASLDAVNTAFNAIMNAIAEQSVHPTLFKTPDDFYINPRAKFSIPFTGTPADQGPDYYLRGAHGIPLPNIVGRLRH
jgi:hypothetical protein